LLTGGLGGPPTAQSQTIVANAAAPNPCFDVETLLASVESGAIAAVKGTWLVGLHKRGGRLSRRQVLPPEAFWSARELRRVARALGDDFGSSSRCRTGGSQRSTPIPTARNGGLEAQTHSSPALRAAPCRCRLPPWCRGSR
jgi:hypothetical protein